MILTCVHCILPVTVCIALAAADVRFLFSLQNRYIFVVGAAASHLLHLNGRRIGLCGTIGANHKKKLFNIFNTKLIFGIPPINVKTHETCTLLVQQLHTRHDSNERIASNHFIWIRSLSPWFLCPLATHVSMID